MTQMDKNLTNNYINIYDIQIVNEFEFPAISVTVFVSRFEKVGKTISAILILLTILLKLIYEV